MNIVDYFNKIPRIGILSTASKDGRTNIASINSTRMIDKSTVEIDIGNCRTFTNLKENPYASFIIIEEGKSLMEWNGVRVYMKIKEIFTEGEKLIQAKTELEKKVGKAAADSIYATVVCEVYEIRPLIDRGQGWGNSNIL